MPLTGILNASVAGHSVSFFSLFAIPPLLPEDPLLSQLAVATHLACQFVVCGLVAFHVAAAMTHCVVRRTRILDRMLPLRRPR